MNRWWLFAIGAVCGAVIALLPRATMHLDAGLLHAAHGGCMTPGAARVHTEEKFVFTAHAPMEEVAPLFGANKERVWSPEWNPLFVYPTPATDAPGMVFTVAHDHLKSVWVNTELDLKNGRVQYVYLIPDALVTVITLKLTAHEKQTQVEVAYERTALSEGADEHVRQMDDSDRKAGSEWEKQVNRYLENGK